MSGRPSMTKLTAVSMFGSKAASAEGMEAGKGIKWSGKAKWLFGLNENTFIQPLRIDLDPISTIRPTVE
jgi:hypothetical protein